MKALIYCSSSKRADIFRKVNNLNPVDYPIITEMKDVYGYKDVLLIALSEESIDKDAYIDNYLKTHGIDILYR